MQQATTAVLHHIHCAVALLIDAQMAVRYSNFELLLYKVQTNTRLKREEQQSAPLQVSRLESGAPFFFPL